MSNIVLSIYKQDVSRMCGYAYSSDELTKEQAEAAIRKFASNYYTDLDMVNLIEISKNKYMFDVVSLSDELEEEQVEKDTFNIKNNELSDIKISIYDESTSRVCGYAYSNDLITCDAAEEKIKLVLSYFGYDIGRVNFTTISDKKYMFNAKTKTDEYESTIKRLVKGR